MEGSPRMSLKSYCWRFGKQLLSVCTMDRAAGNHRWPIKPSKRGHSRTGLSFNQEGYLEITSPRRESVRMAACGAGILGGLHFGGCLYSLATSP